MIPPSLALPASWQGLFSLKYAASDYERLVSIVDQRYATEAVLPAAENVFRALERVPPAATKVIILGQDPYPTPGNAHGLSFSVQPGGEDSPLAPDDFCGAQAHDAWVGRAGQRLA